MTDYNYWLDDESILKLVRKHCPTLAKLIPEAERAIVDRELAALADEVYDDAYDTATYDCGAGGHNLR